MLLIVVALELKGFLPALVGTTDAGRRRYGLHDGWKPSAATRMGLGVVVGWEQTQG